MVGKIAKKNINMSQIKKDVQESKEKEALPMGATNKLAGVVVKLHVVEDEMGLTSPPKNIGPLSRECVSLSCSSNGFTKGVSFNEPSAESKERGPSRDPCVGTIYTHPSRVGGIQQLFLSSWYH